VNVPSSVSAALRRTPVLIAIGVAVVVVIVWLLAYFLPQGHKLSTLKDQNQSLQQQVAAGNAKVTQLQKTFQHTSEIEALDQKMAEYVPSTSNVFKTTANYTSLLSTAVATAHMTLTSVSPSGSSAAGKSFMVIPVTLIATGTYDDLLQLIHDVYTLPRLTDIKSLSITGGGPGTNRGTDLKVTLSLQAFTTTATAGTSGK
jgi:Tfp pilus assembly protein PilO